MRNGKYLLVIAPSGYPGKKYRNRYCYEHRLVWWQNTGDIADGLIIHHKDHDKHNNIFSNLAVLDNITHSHLHGRESERLWYRNCIQCSDSFILSRPSSKSKFCSRYCIGKYNFPGRKNILI